MCKTHAHISEIEIINRNCNCICYCNCNPRNVSLFVDLTSWLFLDRQSRSFMFNARDGSEPRTQHLSVCCSPWSWKVQTGEKFKLRLYDALINSNPMPFSLANISWLLTSCVFCVCTEIDKTNIFPAMADLTILPWNHSLCNATYWETLDSAIPELFAPHLSLCTL